MNRREILKLLGLAPIGGLLSLSGSGKLLLPIKNETAPENYFIGNHNRLAWQISRYFIDSNSAPHLLYLSGSYGTGKTCLLDLLKNESLKSNASANVIFLDLGRYFNDCVRQNRNEIEAFQEKIRETDLLILDNLQYIAGLQYFQADVAELIKYRIDHGRKVIISTDEDFRYLKRMYPAMIPMIVRGVHAEIKYTELEERYEFAKFSAARFGVCVSDWELKKIANKTDSPRQIESELKRILSW